MKKANPLNLPEIIINEAEMLRHNIPRRAQKASRLFEPGDIVLCRQPASDLGEEFDLELNFEFTVVQYKFGGIQIKDGSRTSKIFYDSNRFVLGGSHFAQMALNRPFIGLKGVVHEFA